MSEAKPREKSRRAARLPGSGTYRAYRPITPLSPVVVAIGPRVPCEELRALGVTVVHIAEPSAAAQRVLEDRNVVAVVVVEATYDAVDEVLRLVRESAQRLPAVVACTVDDWPFDSRWGPSRRVHSVRCGAQFGADANALIASFVALARERFARIARYCEEHRLSELESDVLWHRVRGVPYDRLEDAQGCGYDTKKKRLISIREKTSHDDVDDAMREALGIF